MSLRLMLDADIQGRSLVVGLRAAGHDVLTANEAGLRTAGDAAVLGAAISEKRILLTFNAGDFEKLHKRNDDHSGIIAVYKNRIRRKHMSNAEIVKALANLESAGWDLTGQFIALNRWNY